MTGFRWEIIEEYGPLFMDGALMTIKCTIICVILGTLWGLTLGLGRMAKAEHGVWKYVLRYLVQFPVRFYVSAFRGTPLFVQIMVVHFALVPLFINPRDGFAGDQRHDERRFCPRAALKLWRVSLLYRGDYAERRGLRVGDLPRRDPVDR
ncbi:Amino acid ABC transporter [Klebsiella oxytoca]|nr:Amino acid ABC transporter [Klebsiella oxytoca]